MNVLLVLCVIISLPFVRLHSAMSLLCLLVTSVVILLKMIYHLDLVPNAILQSNCSVSFFSAQFSFFESSAFFPMLS